MVQRAINGSLTLDSLGAMVIGLSRRRAVTDPAALTEILNKGAHLNALVASYDQFQPGTRRRTRKNKLKKINDLLSDIQSQLDILIAGLRDTTGQDPLDARTYVILVGLQTQMTQLNRAANDETVSFFHIVRVGSGGRPDANTEDAIDRSAPDNFALSSTETTFFNNFVENQGGGWKERREALSAIWAKRQGLFTNLTPGKVEDDPTDVEYRTTDRGYQLWDQKTIFTAETAFDGRIVHTHTKVKDDRGKGAIGLLFDSTFENPTNYEKAWLSINRALLSGGIAPGAVREVKAPNPAGFSADIYVDMTQTYGSSTVAANVKWAEGKRAGRQSNGLEVIAASQLTATNYAAVKNGTGTSYSRYSNNRDWLPPAVYNEYGVSAGPPNTGKARFVATDDRGSVYLTVTHYKGFTVKPSGAAAVNRNPFYKIE